MKTSFRRTTQTILDSKLFFLRHWTWLASLLVAFMLLMPVVTVEAQASCPNPYVVKAGDWWTRIAQRCGVSYEALRQANPDLWARRGQNIRPGDSMIIPTSSVAIPTSTPIPLPTPTPYVPPIYIWYSGSVPTGMNSNHQITLGFDFNDPNQYANIEIYGIDGGGICRTPSGVIYRAADLASCVVNTGRGGNQFPITQIFATVNGARQELTPRLVLTQVPAIQLVIQPTATPPPPPTPIAIGCVGASNPPLRVGDMARICTRQDTVTMRGRPGDSFAQIDPALQPGAQFTIIDGPVCSGYGQATYPWWRVQTTTGQVGWLADARDNRDPVFLCRVDGGSTSPPVSSNYSGTWYSNFAEIRLVQQGSTFTGSYLHYGSNRERPIRGSVNGPILNGAVPESGTTFVFTFDEGNQRFDGIWTSPYDGRSRQWCGVRSGPLPDGCGFSGYWPSRIGGDSGWTRLTQVGAVVNGDFNNGTEVGTISGQLGAAGNDPHYSLTGAYALPSGHGTVRLDLLDLGSRQFQGCWLGERRLASGAWCGARESVSLPGQCRPVNCP